MRTLLLLSLLLLAGRPVLAQVLDQDTRWSGERQMAETLVVPAGVTLTVAAGSRVSFAAGAGLEVAGRLVAEAAEFAGTGWPGITLKGCDATTRLRGATIRGAKTGLLVQGGAPQLEGLQLTENEVGIELRGKSAASLDQSHFSANRKVGLFIKDDSLPRVRDCRFAANGRYGAYIYRAKPAEFSGNRFTGNPTGLMIAYFGSDPLIAGNVFETNETAILVDRAARPELRGNRLTGNRLGLHLYRRSDPLVTGNRLERNEVGILVAYSSYPRIAGNDFEANGLALKLEFQSSQWEASQGASARANETAQRSGFGGQAARTVTEADRRARDLDGTLDARGNWWGVAGSRELAQAAGRKNPGFIHDGRDQATFEDGGRTYPLDQVVFTPWSDHALTGSLP